MSKVSEIEKSWFELDNVSDKMKDIMSESMEKHVNSELKMKKETMQVLEDSIQLKEDLIDKIIIDKPEIPQFIANFIESFDDDTSLFVVTEQIMTIASYRNIYNWYSLNVEEFNLAWQYAYIVIPEEKYIVISELPGENSNRIILMRDAKTSTAKVMPLVGEFDGADSMFHFTELEIKSFAPGLWDMRKKVEE